MALSWTCASCQQVHVGLPALGWSHPDLVRGIPPEERATRVVLDSDVCIVDEKHFFILGCLDLPVQGDDDATLRFLVWVSQGQQSFQRLLREFDRPGREHGPATFGWLGSNLAPHYPDTLNLKTMVHQRPVGQRPFVELEPTKHPLAVHQREGIPLEQAIAIATALLHQ
jgi:hypothetical protein